MVGPSNSIMRLAANIGAPLTQQTPIANRKFCHRLRIKFFLRFSAQNKPISQIYMFQAAISREQLCIANVLIYHT
jgi:hypothetical protein